MSRCCYCGIDMTEENSRKFCSARKEQGLYHSEVPSIKQHAEYWDYKKEQPKQ